MVSGTSAREEGLRTLTSPRREASLFKLGRNPGSGHFLLNKNKLWGPARVPPDGASIRSRRCQNPCFMAALRDGHAFEDLRIGSTAAKLNSAFLFRASPRGQPAKSRRQSWRCWPITRLPGIGRPHVLGRRAYCLVLKNLLPSREVAAIRFLALSGCRKEGRGQGLVDILFDPAGELCVFA
jgi:hypothetical protein